MPTMRGVALAILLAMAGEGAASAAKLMRRDVPVAVARSELTVTPAEDWNRIGTRPGRNAESWTLDGLGLNDLTFYGGIADDRTLFRDARRKTDPLPRYSRTMLAPDIARLFESSYRVAAGTSLMAIDMIEPARFAGRPGFRFAYHFTLQGEEVRRKGEATGAVVDGQLYLIAFEAPEIHYFDAGIERARAIIASARIVPIVK